MNVQKNFDDIFANAEPAASVTDLLSGSEEAIREGNGQRAYELALRATEIAPENVDAWLLRATLARSLDERITCVNHLNELAPDGHDRYDVAFFALKDALDQNPFLRYLEETDALYRVINAEHVVLSIPKKRAPADPFPPEQDPSPLRVANRLLSLAILGLLAAGIGTVIFAPMAAFAAIGAHRSVETHEERVKSIVVAIVSSGLFIIGFVFGLLFVLHLFG